MKKIFHVLMPKDIMAKGQNRFAFAGMVIGLCVNTQK